MGITLIKKVVWLIKMRSSGQKGGIKNGFSLVIHKNRVINTINEKGF
jgi:hypothetical protein